MGGIRVRVGIEAVYCLNEGFESAETAKIKKDTAGERSGLESGIVAAAGAKGRTSPRLLAVRVFRPPMV
jgi:hypothetical protein